MGQVPQYLLIGRGRVARHFSHYFAHLGISFQVWHRGLPAQDLPRLAAGATHILLLVSDGAVADVAVTLGDTPALKIHFSGSLNAEGVIGAHPLMTFGPDLYAVEKYTGIPFVIDADAPEFAALLPGLRNPHARLDKAQKARYHAACVMAGNFSCLLWQNLFDTLADDFGIPPETAHMYLRQQTENLISDYKSALTGPLARGDTATVARNLQALSGDAFQPIYQSFVDAYPRIKEKKK